MIDSIRNGLECRNNFKGRDKNMLQSFAVGGIRRRNRTSGQSKRLASAVRDELSVAVWHENDRGLGCS